MAGHRNHEFWLCDDSIEKKIKVLEKLLSDIFGPDQIVVRGTKLEILDMLGASDLNERLSAMEKIIYYDASYNDSGPMHKRAEKLVAEVGEMIARRNIEDQLEKIVADKMQEKQDDYYREIKLQMLKEQTGPENPATQKKLEQIKKLSYRKLNGKAQDEIRPTELSRIVGQERAVDALLAKIASPYPQHVILYGPPGVGKTSAARLVLEEAKKMPDSAFDPVAPFVEVDGSTLRWDPRETTNPLLGSVHDPIYQGARRDLAETGIPEPKPGLVTEASGGILFIDEIGEMDPILLNKLLKVLEDKKVTFDSSYYDPSDPMVPEYIRFMFEKGLPADFILIGATTRDVSEIPAALRSRCAEVYFEPLSPDHIASIVENTAEHLEMMLEKGVAELISEYTVDGRKAVNILMDAYGHLAYHRFVNKSQRKLIRKPMVMEILRNARMTPYRRDYGKETETIGKIHALGVYGYLGTVLEIEVVTYPSQEPGKGVVRFNDTAGSMAKDSMFNAFSAIRLLTGKNLADYDIHVNVVGGGNIDGPSAGLAVFLAIYSSIKSIPIPQNLAVTGEISIRGKICPVGGIPEKLYGAKRAGIDRVLVPKDNAAEVPEQLEGIRLLVYEDVAHAVEKIFGKDTK